MGQKNEVNVGMLAKFYRSVYKFEMVMRKKQILFYEN
jgi:hypothetical protein